jgi:hypothetical protein
VGNDASSRFCDVLGLPDMAADLHSLTNLEQDRVAVY